MVRAMQCCGQCYSAGKFVAALQVTLYAQLYFMHIRYTGELLTLAHDLADRLLMAFDVQTKTGLPHPRVNLQTGVPFDGHKVSCAAGVGSLILEFGK